jgi:hypothetical protein
MSCWSSASLALEASRSLNSSRAFPYILLRSATDVTPALRLPAPEAGAQYIVKLVDSDTGPCVFKAIRGNLCAFRTNVGDVGTGDGSRPST